MKTPQTILRAGGLLLLAFLFAAVASYGQAAQPTVYAVVSFYKATPGQEAEYEKLLKENVRPAIEYRKKNGAITAWRFYKVHFKGDDGKYNYVSVSYVDTWAKTQGSPIAETMKAVNPKVDPAVALGKINAIRRPVGTAIYFREDVTVGKPDAPMAKFAIIDFMKVKDNQFNEYVKIEKEDWKPVHQALVDDNKRAAWALWSLVMPAGLEQGHEYVTSNTFATYEQIGAGNYTDAFKKAHPGKDPQAAFDRASKARDQVRSELWELVDSL